MTSNVEQKKLKKILCIDDEQNILESLNRTLRNPDYEIITTVSPSQGLEIVRSQAIDLIITDLRMPEMDGVEFLSQVRQTHKSIPCILLTGFSEQDSTVRAINDGHISAFVSKPWDNNDLKAKVSSWLRIGYLEKEKKRLLMLTHNQNKQLQEWNKNLESKVAAKVTELQDAECMLDAAYDELSSSYDSVVKLLSEVICANPHMISRGNPELPNLAKSIAEQAGLNEYFIKQVYFAGLLFEVGKLSLPERLLMEPARLLSISDFKELMTYPEIGAGLLEDISNFHATSQIIKHHYEYIDGSGSPYGLQGEDIPVGSRILSIVKDYYLLQSGKFNGLEHTAKNALKFLVERKGKLYDEQLVNLLTATLKNNESEPESQLEAEASDERVLTSRQLRIGMILSRDCRNGEGPVILEKGAVISDDTLEKLVAFEKVYDLPLKFYIR